MYNLYTHIYSDPSRCRRLTCDQSLFTIYNCRLKSKYEDLWSHLNYIIYVAEGRKIWHTAHGSYDLQAGSCVFVRKGACIVEQFFHSEYCFFLFFVSDEFIRDVLRGKSRPVQISTRKYGAVMTLDHNKALETYIQSMMVHIESTQEPDPSLLELKFRELVLTIADNPANIEALSYFSSLLQEPQTASLVKVMEDNFSFNLRLEDFAKLSSRSLSTFKRDFQKQFNTTPGKWLMEKRLNHSMYLLTHEGKTVGEAAFESGFESPAHFSRCFRQYFGTPPTSVKHKMTA